MYRTLNFRPNYVFFVKAALIMALLAIGGVIAAPGTTTPLEYTRRALEGLRQMNRDSLSPTDAQHHSAAMESIENLEELLLVQGHSESEAGTYRLQLCNYTDRFWSDIDLSYIGGNLIIQNRGTTRFQSFERDPEREGTWRARRPGRETRYSVDIIDQRTFRMLLTYYTTDRNVNTPTSQQYEAYYQMIAQCQPGQPEPETRTTTTGAIFTRDRSHPTLGEAWRDPSGLIWGDTVKNEDGSVRRMVQSSEWMRETGRSFLPEGELGAEEYCESIGARLPSQEEFARLREYMGAEPGTREGYSHHDDNILPNLINHWFWSSSVSPNNTVYAYDFNGTIGSINSPYRNNSDGAVRCVVLR